MDIAFIMDPLESIDSQLETTTALMAECNNRGHEVYFLGEHDLYVRANKVLARMWHVTVPRGLGLQAYWEEVVRSWRAQAPRTVSLEEIDAIFMRKDPPLDVETVGHLQIVRKAVGHLRMALTFEPANEFFKEELDRLQPPRKKKKKKKA